MGFNAFKMFKYQNVLISANFDISYSMAANSRHRKKTFRIENKLSESRKKLWNPEKYFRVQKKKKKKRNREKFFFGIEKKNSESRNICYKNREKILNSMASNSMNLPANIYLFKVNNRNTRKRCKICSKLIIKTSKQCQ